MNNTPVLLVGNSPNRIHTSNPVSWDSILKHLRELAKLTIEDEDHNDKPFPLHFEEIHNVYLQNHPKQNKNFLINEICKNLRSLKGNDIHKSLMSLPFRNILTTNYDHCLEMEATTPFIKDNFEINENKYNLFR